MSFEKEVIEQEIAIWQDKLVYLQHQQQEHSAAAVSAHVTAHNTVIVALQTVQSGAGSSASAVIQARIDQLIAARDSLQEHDYTAEITAVQATISELEAVLPST